MNQSQIKKNKIVSLSYTLQGNDREIFFSNVGLMPLVYLHGYGNIIPGLEKEIEGMSIGERKKIKIDPEYGYGPVEKKLIVKKSLESIGRKCKVGDKILFQVEGENREMRIVRIQGDLVTLDGNHPLAGKTLIFDVEIVKISDASDSEILCGYPIEDAISFCNKSDNCC